MPDALAEYILVNYTVAEGFAYAFSYAVFAAASISYANYQRRRSEKKARDAANASLKDREVMIRSGVAPRRIIYGRDKVSGPVVFMQSTGDKSQYLHLVIALATHECDEIEEIYFNEIRLPELDSDGFVPSGEFFSASSTEFTTYTGTTDLSGNITLPEAAISVESVYQSVGVGEASSQIQYPERTHTSGTNIVGNLPFETEVTVGYTFTSPGAAKVRIRKYLGDPDQVADPDLITESGGLWTTDHVGEGICYLYVRLEYDQAIFGSINIPNISAVVRGKKVYDPRLDVTQWSNCAALCTADWLKSAEGMNADDEEVPDDEISTAANICDEEVDLYDDGTVSVTAGSTTVVGNSTEWRKYAMPGLTFVGPDSVHYLVSSVTDDTHLELNTVYGGSTTSGAYLFKQARYTCDTSFTTDTSPIDVLAELNECMAGRTVWTQGRWLVRAGAYVTPTLTITEDMLAGPISSIAPKASRSELFNAVRAMYRDRAHNFAEMQAPLVKNAGYEADDGDVRIVRQIDIPSLADSYRAQRMAKIELERARQALTVRLTTNLKAYDATASDVVLLTLAYYGWTAKPFEVIERTFANEGRISYVLRETASGVWDWAFGEETLGDLAPDTDLPSPYAVPAALTGLDIDNYTVLLDDGTIVVGAQLSWDPSADAFVRAGGHIEVEWARVDNLIINSVRRSGTDVDADLSPLLGAFAYIARVRQVNGAGKISDWAYINFIAGVDDDPPEDVTGLDWEIKPGLVRIWCDPCIAKDYAETELRYMNTEPDSDAANWDDATFLVSGKSNEYHHPRPPNGTYWVLAKHKDTSGNYSENEAIIEVLVDDSIDGLLGGDLNLSTDRFPFFSFADGTTHTAQAPGADPITFTATLTNLLGTPTFTAEAFDLTGTGSLGAITLTGSGLSRTMTAAAFVAPGTSGSVRYAVVTATLAGISDFVTVYRQDSTTTDPILYLSNPFEAVPTDSNGDYGDYSNATTYAVVFIGLTDDTANWSFAITPDSGVTATINGGAGPVTGTASVLIAVTNMTVPDGAVLITASKSGETNLTASFYVTKSEGTPNGMRIYWDPRSEIVLPVGADGLVSSFVDAYSSLRIETAAGVDDSANWTFTKVDTNVVSTLTGNLVEVTALVQLGTTGTTSAGSAPSLPSGWLRAQKLAKTDYGWACFGYESSGSGHTKVMISTDFVTWTTVDHGGTARNWHEGAANGNVVVTVPMGVVGVADIRYSSNGGQTWSAGSRTSTTQPYFCTFLGSHFIITEIGTGARISTDGVTWSAITMPGSTCKVWGTTGRWIAEDSSGNYYFSTNAGSSWVACSGLPASLTALSVVIYKGRAIIIPAPGSANKDFYYTDVVNGGNAWVKGQLPEDNTANGPFIGVVKGVLYFATSGGDVMYTTDGNAWRYSGGTCPSVFGTTAWNGGSPSEDLQFDYIPFLDLTAGTTFKKTPLLATSETDGFVTVTATKPGEVDIVRVLPVRRGTVNEGGRAFFAIPYTLSLPATSDGLVTDFTNATITAGVQYNGGTETALWTWSWTAVNMTPSSGSTNVATFTAMGSSDTGSVTFVATRAGYPSVTGTLSITKNKGSDGSGPRIGAAYSLVDAANTLIGVRFNTDGSVDVKRGSGSYTRLTQWAGLVASGVGNSYWLYVAPRAGTHALSTGTENSWLALSSARTYEMSDATSGTHLYEADVFIGTSSSGANAIAGYFSMRLLVP